MKKIMTIIGAIVVASFMMTSCGGNKVAPEQVIADSLATGKKYYQKTKNFEGGSWLTFEGPTVVFTIYSLSTTWSGYRIIERKDITGKYAVINNNGSFTIECDFGIQSINLKLSYNKEETSDCPLPIVLVVEMDSLNNVHIKNWEIELSIEKVAEQFAKALNNQEFDAAKKHVTGASEQMLDKLASMSAIGGHEGGKVQEFKNFKSEISDNRAKVTYLADGKPETLDLVKVGEKWLVELKKE